MSKELLPVVEEASNSSKNVVYTDFESPIVFQGLVFKSIRRGVCEECVFHKPSCNGLCDIIRYNKEDSLFKIFKLIE